VFPDVLSARSRLTRRWMAMPSLAAAVALLLAACVSRPDLLRTPNALQVRNCADGMRLMGHGWEPSIPPADAEKMLAPVRFEVAPQGLIWYTREGESSIAACAFTRDRNGCGYSGHLFKSEAGSWFHATVWVQDRICVLA
jgi:hypothetical protein